MYIFMLIPFSIAIVTSLPVAKRHAAHASSKNKAIYTAASVACGWAGAVW